MKVERFLKEYASYQKKCIAGYSLMEKKYKEKASIKINTALSAREKGLITVDEAIKQILECLG